MAQSPHQKSGERRKHCQKMDRLHLDLVGPLSVPSAHGSCTYFQSGIDVGTRHSFVNVLKSKSDVLTVSKALISTLEVDSETTSKCLRTDGGGEYVSAAWQHFSHEKGFVHELTAPYRYG